MAKSFGVTAQEIIDWPGNRLDPGIDPANPPIEPGTVLVIPGGHREFVTWSAPRITRANPAAARILGPGYCGTVTDGPVGDRDLHLADAQPLPLGLRLQPGRQPSRD